MEEATDQKSDADSRPARGVAPDVFLDRLPCVGLAARDSSNGDANDATSFEGSCGTGTFGPSPTAAGVGAGNEGCSATGAGAGIGAGGGTTGATAAVSTARDGSAADGCVGVYKAHSDVPNSNAAANTMPNRQPSDSPDHKRRIPCGERFARDGRETFDGVGSNEAGSSTTGRGAAAEKELANESELSIIDIIARGTASDGRICSSIAWMRLETFAKRASGFLARARSMMSSTSAVARAAACVPWVQPR